MATEYNVTAEFDTRDEDLDEKAVDALAAYHAATGRSDRGRLEVILTIPAEDLVQVVQTAVAITAQAIGVPILTVAIAPTEEWDARQGLTPIPELVSVTEAASELGVSRQAVLQRLQSGSLPGRQVGTAWVIPRAALGR